MIRAMELQMAAAPVLDYLRDVGAEFVIAGGYPRDLRYGVPPKDLDIWVYGWEGSMIEDVCRMPGYYDKTDQENSDASATGEDFDERRIFAVISNGDIDVIFCGRDIDSEPAVLEMFDYNVNQFVCTIVQDCVTVEYKGEGPVPSSVMHLRKVRPISDQRKDYMIQKALQLFGTPA